MMPFQIILVKTSILPHALQVALDCGCSRTFIAHFVGVDTFAYFTLLQNLDNIFAAQRLAERALHASILYLVCGKVRLTKFPSVSRFLGTEVESASSECSLLIYVDRDLAVHASVPPRWVRDKLGLPEKRAIQLIALNAYVSTLGGGHYLCKHVEDAWALALRQQAISLALDDQELAGQCRIHLAYICMQMGKLREARRRLRLEDRFAIKIESNKLRAVVHAAEVYLTKLELREAELKNMPEDKLRDEFYRQRFVQPRRKFALDAFVK